MKLYNCDIYRFMELISRKKVICFGAGQALKNFLSFFKDFYIEKYIDCIADNNSEKAGEVFQFGHTKIPIVGAADIKKQKNYILLISCHDACGVYEQLNRYPELNEVWCFVTRFICSETNQKDEKSRKYPESYRITQEPLIPKKIHYCWFGKGEIPDQNKRWMESWSKYCPDYEIIRWDESNYDVTKNSYMYEAYQAKKWGFVPDYARMDIIYNHGGIYLDTDVELLKNLDELLYQKAFAGIEGTRNINWGLGFGAYKGCSIIKNVRDFYIDKSFKNEDGSLKIVAAPILQKDFFTKRGYVNNGEYQVIDEMTVYPEKILSAKCNFTGRICPTAQTFSVHHYDGSWTPELKRENLKNAELFNKAIII